MITIVLLVLSLACFLAVTFNFPSKINLTALGLALWVLSVLLSGVHVGL
jgi:hypothetical protein